MDKNAYAMAKFGLESRDSLISRKGCGFYMKYVFLFTSVIQFLIILGLVLFMIYGNAHASTDTHVQHLEDTIQGLYNKITALSNKNLNLTKQLNATMKEKLACSQQAATTQKELEKCNASMQTFTALQMQLQSVMNYAQYYKLLAEMCYRNLDFLNISCYGETLRLRQEKENLAAEIKHQKENCSKEMEKLQQMGRSIKGQLEFCEKQVIDLRAERSELTQAKDKCCDLGEKVSGRVQAAKETILSLLPPQLSSCSSLSSTMTMQLKAMGEKLEQDVQAQAQQNGRLHGDNLRCRENLQECKRLSIGEAQQLQQVLQAKQASCDAEAKRNYEEKRVLKEDMERLKQQMQEKTNLLQQADRLKAQLEMCRKGKVASFPANPGTFGNPGILGNPGIFGNPGTPGKPGTFGNPGTPGNPGIFGNPGTLGNPAPFGIPGTLGNPGAFGNPMNMDKTSLDESIQRMILQNSKLHNQLPPQSVAQSSG